MSERLTQNSNSLDISNFLDDFYSQNRIPVETQIPLKLLHTKLNGPLFYPSSDTIMSNAILTSGYWEPLESAWLAKNLKPDDCFLNIGANVGYHSIFVAKNIRQCHVISVEPNPIAVLILRVNQFLHNLEFEILECAIGPTSSEVEIFLDAYNFGDARVQKFLGASLVGKTQMYSVSDFFNDKPRPNVILMDIQGMELSILNDIFDYSANQAKVMFEFTPKELSSNLNYAVEIYSEVTRNLKISRLDADLEIQITPKQILDLFLNSELENVNLIACQD